MVSTALTEPTALAEGFDGATARYCATQFAPANYNHTTRVPPTSNFKLRPFPSPSRLRSYLASSPSRKWIKRLQIRSRSGGSDKTLTRLSSDPPARFDRRTTTRGYLRAGSQCEFNEHLRGGENGLEVNEIVGWVQS